MAMTREDGVTEEPLSGDELAEITARADSSTPGPWFFRLLDDDWHMSLVAVTTSPATADDGRAPTKIAVETIAATLVQHPRYVTVADERWEENAKFIAHARTDVPRLVTEIKRLRALLADVDDETA
jgi:hypothetical protein